MFVLETTSLCDQCKVVNDLEHIILRCRKIREIRDKFTFSSQFSDLPNLLREINVERYREIAHFYRDANLDF